MEPASTIIKRLGGRSVVAARCGVLPNRPSYWKMPKERGGTDGLIPAKHIPALIAFGREIGEELTTADFSPGVDQPAVPSGAAA